MFYNLTLPTRVYNDVTLASYLYLYSLLNTNYFFFNEIPNDMDKLYNSSSIHPYLV